MQHLVSSIDKREDLPSQREIADKLGISRSAVQHALRHLQDEGVVSVKQRSGIEVNKKIDINMLGMQSMTAELGNQNVKIKHLSTSSVQVTKQLQNFFGSKTSQLLKIERIHCNRDKPLSYEITYFNKAEFPTLEKVDFTNLSLYQILCDEYNAVPTYGKEDITCILADDRLAKALQVKDGEPLYQIESFNYQADDRPLECTRQYLIGKQFKYYFTANNIFDYQED